MLPTRHVIRPWPLKRWSQTKGTLLRQLAHLRDAVSADWHGPQDAVDEIRTQRRNKTS